MYGIFKYCPPAGADCIAQGNSLVCVRQHKISGATIVLDAAIIPAGTSLSSWVGHINEYIEKHMTGEQHKQYNYKLLVSSGRVFIGRGGYFIPGG